MNWPSWLLWGFLATLALTALLASSQGLKLTRMNLPFILGAIFTPDRERARTIGFFVHLGLGLVFALLYVLVFHQLGKAGSIRGAILGLGHAVVVLTVLMPLMPGFHPRMASEQAGPTAMRRLEPPGFLGMHYGSRTPISVVVTHVVYGALLGTFYAMR